MKLDEDDGSTLTAFSFFRDLDLRLLLAGVPLELADVVVGLAVGAADGVVVVVAVGALAEGKVLALHADRVMVTRPFRARTLGF